MSKFLDNADSKTQKHDHNQSICAVVRSTPTHYAVVHTVCGRLFHIECAVSMHAGKYQVCDVRKFYLYLKQKPINVFMMFYSYSTTNLGVN